MKKHAGLFLFPVLYLFAGCSKGSSTTTPPLTAEVWPQNWVLTIDYSATTYKYLHRVGIVINRNEVEKSYSMSELAKEKDCNWEVSSAGQVGGKETYTFRLAKNKNIRWIVSTTATVSGLPEFILSTHDGANPPNTDDYRFYLYDRGKQNGHKTVSIESVSHPGYYLDNIGHTLTANGVKLLPYSNAEGAVRFERH
jgi:hypothetical protein